MAVYLGNQIMGEYLGSNPTIIEPIAEIELLQSGLVFDFRAKDYQSGSLLWTSHIGNYTASVTGSTSGGLNYIDGMRVGFDGNHWLQFNNETTASISSSQWQVYALVEFTGQQTSSTAFVPELFSKGGGISPSWNYAYKGGSPFPNNKGFGFIDGGDDSAFGYQTDTLNNFMTGSRQLFALTMFSGSSWPNQAQTGSFTINQYVGTVGSTIYYDEASINTSFTGSASAPLLFGKAVNGNTTNISGSVIRLFAYNKILDSTEREANWQILNQYP